MPEVTSANTQGASAPTDSSSERGPHDRRRVTRTPRRRLHSGDLWLLLVFGAILVLLMADLIKPVFDFLYSPVALVILVVMLIEFLVLKARDRSRLLRIEIQMMRNRRREDVRLMRETRDELRALRSELAALALEIETAESVPEPIRERFDAIEEKVKKIEESIIRR